MGTVRRLQANILLSFMVAGAAAHAGTYPFTKETISRDQILEIAHLYYGVYWRCDPENAYGTSIPDARCPYDTEDGWKEALPYCWGGDDEIYEYLEKMTDGQGAGDRDTGSASPYYDGLVGSVDCSGYASQCFRSGRYSTYSFHNVTTDIGWDNLAPGDATNWPSHHIRICEKYPTETGLILVYESTGSGWQVRHRLLPRDNDYDGVRYNHTTPIPSILDVLRTGYGEVTITWFGQAATGFRIYQSTDGSTWNPVLDENDLDSDADTATIVGCDPDRTYYFRVTAVNGPDESAPSTVFPVRLPETERPPVLLVHAYDRWIRQDSQHEFNDFLIRYAEALDSSLVNFETCDNFRVTRGEIDLADYQTVVWMVGEESSKDYTLNFLEELEIQAYLRGGGCLFISGSEIGWDLVELEPAIDNIQVDDSQFYSEFLKAQYVADDAGVYSAGGIDGTIFEGLSFSFDDGTHGTYDVDWADVLDATGGSVACLSYGGSDYAAVQYSGLFSGGAVSGKVVYMAIPFETIVDAVDRRAVMSAVLGFFLGSEVSSWRCY